jgi:DNA-binding transcriptional LysR family regulator
MAAPNLNLQAMKIFVAVFDLRSVNLAARSLNISQSGLSTTLAKLRRDLGDALFLSTAAGMQPTSRAKEVVGAMREAIQCMEQRILNKGRFDPAQDEREFRVALSDTAEAMYMPRALAALTRAAPRVRLRSVATASRSCSGRCPRARWMSRSATSRTCSRASSCAASWAPMASCASAAPPTAT